MCFFQWNTPHRQHKLRFVLFFSFFSVKIIKKTLGCEEEKEFCSHSVASAQCVFNVSVLPTKFYFTTTKKYFFYLFSLLCVQFIRHSKKTKTQNKNKSVCTNTVICYIVWMITFGHGQMIHLCNKLLSWSFTSNLCYFTFMDQTHKHTDQLVTRLWLIC